MHHCFNFLLYLSIRHGRTLGLRDQDIAFPGHSERLIRAAPIQRKFARLMES